ncbi:hypothetical protein Tco_1428057 [Tanacetum coccineum]
MNVPKDGIKLMMYPYFARELVPITDYGVTQVEPFTTSLNENEQDSLNAAAGGNLLSKKTREALNISKTDERIDKLADQLSTLVEIVSKKVVTPAPVKAVEETCVTCGGAHSWYNCPATDNNQAYGMCNPRNLQSS